KERFIIKGESEDVNETMRNYRLLIAPIPFGAGLKGKFIDGFKNGLPNITTKFGAEGMDVESWGGVIEENEEDFVDKTVLLYNDEDLWSQSQRNGIHLVNQYFSLSIWNGVLKEAIDNILDNLLAHRSDLFVQKILWQNILQATKYMSLWIEAKNKE
ncbi:MAG TPA: hypothetical protein VKY82_00030, partial [Flavobacterium sp.]|nr:hypothetical protein [Flavobacterium sp.]